MNYWFNKILLQNDFVDVKYIYGALFLNCLNFYVTFFDRVFIFSEFVCLLDGSLPPKLQKFVTTPFQTTGGGIFTHSHQFSPLMPVCGREVRFNQAPYLRYYQSTHFEISFEISLKKIKSARMIEKVK